MKRMAVITWRLRKKEMELLGVRSLITVFSLTYPLFFFSLFIFVNSYSGALSDSVCILISLFLISLFLISLFYQSRIFPPLLRFIFSLTFLSLPYLISLSLSLILYNSPRLNCASFALSMQFWHAINCDSADAPTSHNTFRSPPSDCETTERRRSK